eukprot:gb/GFBE01021786.1/.p1 GENE.gb/GFBE01021786.1/~~gb/GFBE01021786.1/.p1  ORF type:complete len:562 (+),score=152.34 gb/GFBE01021786.1/:1-1686(+)
MPRRGGEAWKEPEQPDEEGSEGSSEQEHNWAGKQAAEELLKEKRAQDEAEKKRIQEYEQKMSGAGSKAAQINKFLKVNPDEFTGIRKMLHHVMSWWGFDAIIGFVIVVNAVTIGIETQYKSTVPIGCTPECDCKQQVDPTLTCEHPPALLQPLDYGFFAVYLLEVTLRLAVYGPFVLKSHWVKFDLFLVLTAALDIILKLVADSNELKMLMLVRMLRLARLARALRLMVQFRTLWQLVQGLLHSVGTLLWTFLLVIILMYIGAVIGMEFIKVDETLPIDHPYNVAAQDNFQNFLDAMMTLLQIFSFDSIGGIYRPLIKHRMLVFLYFMAVMLLLSIALMNLVTAVMVNSSLDQASEDKDAKKAYEAHMKAKQMEQLKIMFLELDEDGSGELTIDEINAAPIEAQEQLQEIAGTDDLKELFEMLDYDGGGTVGVDEFCEGVLKATSSQPGTMELSRLVKQCADILKNSRETVSILNDPDKGFKEFAKSGAGGGGGGGGGNDDEDIDRLNGRVSGMENQLGRMHQDINRILTMVNDKLAMKKTIGSTRSHSPSRRHIEMGKTM